MGDRKVNNPKESSFSLKENQMYSEMEKSEQRFIDKISKLSDSLDDMNRRTDKYQKDVQNTLDALNTKSLIDFLSKSFINSFTNKLGDKINTINKKLESNKERINKSYDSRKEAIEDRYKKAIAKQDAKKLAADLKYGNKSTKAGLQAIFGDNLDEKAGTVEFNGQTFDLKRYKKGKKAGQINWSGAGNNKLFTAGKKQLLDEKFSDKYKRLEKTKNGMLENLAKEQKGELDSSEAIANAAKTKANVKATVVGAAVNTTKLVVKGFVSQVKKGFDTLGVNISNIFGEITANIKQALSSSGIASYSMGTSLFSNSAARQSAMQYGLSSSGNYAFMNAKSMLNIQSDDDLMFMNDNQRGAFSQLTNYYKRWYDKLESTGALEALQKTQIEFKIFKQEMAMKFLNWFSKNKDMIMDAINNTLRLIEIVVPIMIKIANVLAKVAAGFGSIFGNGSSKSVSGTDKVNIQITQNISGSSANAQDITNSNNLLARQLTKAINGM